MTDSDRDGAGADRIAVSGTWGDLEIASYEHGDPAVGKGDPEIAIRLRSPNDYIVDGRMEFCIEPHTLAQMLRTLGFEVSPPGAGGATGALAVARVPTPDVRGVQGRNTPLRTSAREDVNPFTGTNLTHAGLVAMVAVDSSPEGTWTVEQLTDLMKTHTGAWIEEARHVVHSLASDGLLVIDREGKVMFGLVGKALKETGGGVA